MIGSNMINTILKTGCWGSLCNTSNTSKLPDIPLLTSLQAGTSCQLCQCPWRSIKEISKDLQQRTNIKMTKNHMSYWQNYRWAWNLTDNCHFTYGFLNGIKLDDEVIKLENNHWLFIVLFMDWNISFNLLRK